MTMFNGDDASSSSLLRLVGNDGTVLGFSFGFSDAARARLLEG